MKAVLVHGVPDTFHLWDEVRGQISEAETHALALPGFASPIPEGFGASKEDYVQWICEQLEAFGEPVHLVGHDWGCIFTARVASIRPDLVRTWAGGDGPVSAAYPWHPMAQTWQTPGVGEKFMEDLDPAWFSKLMQEYGVPQKKADESVKHIDDLMKRCILRIYRSAVHVGKEWEPGLQNITAPCLVLWGANDVPTPPEFGDLLGQAMRASRVLKLDSGHWTALERPHEMAEALLSHWRSEEATK